MLHTMTDFSKISLSVCAESELTYANGNGQGQGQVQSSSIITQPSPLIAGAATFPLQNGEQSDNYLVKLDPPPSKELGYPNWGTCFATAAFFNGIALTYLPTPLDSHPYGTFIKFMAGSCIGGGAGASSSLCLHKMYKVYQTHSKSGNANYLFVKEKDIRRLHSL